MRAVLMLAALPLFTLAAACSDSGEPDKTPERRSAAGEVLGGEVSDAMLPLDTVRSTSPAAPRAAEPGDPRPGTANGDQAGPLPQPEMSGGPEPLPTADPEAEPAAEPE